MIRKAVTFLVLLIGFLQIIGYCIQSDKVKGLGASLASSPLPIVFTTVKGLETFSSKFYFQITNKNGLDSTIQITPELYSKLKGPYNRRNVYGASIAYGPILDTNLLYSVLDYAICKGVLIEEMNLSMNHEYKIVIHSNDQLKSWTLKPNCNNVQ